MQSFNLNTHDTASAILLRKLWLSENWGVLSEVAIKLGVTPQAVSPVYWGKKRSLRIERALQRKGAPIAKR